MRVPKKFPRDGKGNYNTDDKIIGDKMIFLIYQK